MGLSRLAWLSAWLVVSMAAAGCGIPLGEERSEDMTPRPQEQTRAVQVRELPDQEVPYRPEVVADGLDVPWSLALAPDGRIFVTERPGRIRVIEGGRLLPDSVIAFDPPFVSEGEGGLLGLVLDPDFARNRFLYVYQTYRDDQGDVRDRVLRLREQNNRAAVDRVLLDGIPGSVIHNGGRLAIGPDGHLYVTTGDANEPALAQDIRSLAGKILRIGLDGSIPGDNPFPASPVYSYGNRNPQGLAWSTVTGELYATEHGPAARDEINRIVKGANYGWPVITGDETSPGMRPPLVHSGANTWAPSGMAYVTKGPWAGRFIAANLRGQQLLMSTVDPDEPDRIRSVEAFYRGKYGRLRDVVAAPDGSLYILTNNRDGRGEPRPGDDRIIRLVPTG